MPDARLIYADSEHSADMLYATGMFVPDPFLWVSIDGQALVVMSPLEVSRARQEIKPGTTVYSYSEAKKALKLRSLKPASIIAAISREHKVKRWLAPREFPLGLALELQKRGLKVTTPKDAFFPEREVKTEQEIAWITDGVRLAEAGLNRGLGVLREATIDGDRVVWRDATLTAEILRGEIDGHIASLGGVAAHTIVAPGKHGADPHDSGSGPIRPHEPIVLDIFPRVTATGYWGDLTRTVVKGRASATVKRAYKAVQEARDLAKSMIKSRVTGKAVHDAAMKRLQAHGFETDAKADPPYGFFHGTGHGLGLEIHEAPRVSTAPGTLRKGHVVTVEPGLYYPEWGGIRLEDVVVVGTKDCTCLTTVPDQLEIP